MPTYFFIVMMLVMIGVGIVRMLTGDLEPAHTFAVPGVEHAATLFVVLHAFASGGAAVTGVEAISNGVPAFKSPEWKNARTTLMWMGGILGLMFFGLSLLARELHVVPDPHENRTYGHAGPDNVNSWKLWYMDLLRGRTIREGKVVGFTEAVWRSGAPTSSPSATASRWWATSRRRRRPTRSPCS